MVLTPTICVKSGVNFTKFVVPVLQGFNLCYIDGKIDSFHQIFMVLTPLFVKNRGDPYKFRGSRFPGCDLCAINDKTNSFHVRLSASKQYFEFLWL